MRPHGPPGSTTINLAPGTILRGTIQTAVTINGAPGSMFVNNGNSTANIVKADVFGHGTFTVSDIPSYLSTGTTEFAQFVGPGQTVMNGGVVISPTCSPAKSR
jgi:hypothetical protein